MYLYKTDICDKIVLGDNMNFQISITDDNVKRYPQHKHSFWEIMLYTEGKGYLYTPTENIPFDVGTIIIVPPKIAHGSVSDKPFRNISVGGDFENSFLFDTILHLHDNKDFEGTDLANLLYKNRATDEYYLKALSNAYVNFILMQTTLKKPINTVIEEIKNEILNNAFLYDYNIAKLLNSYNYSPDYIRQQFKIVTGTHPIGFLTKCRIERACFLIDIYGESMPLSKIAENCGYTDYVYFSKQFKRHTKHSPMEYLKQRIG